MEKKKKSEKASKSNKEKKEPSKSTEQNQPDYGGLPNRDFKKNLGCG